MKKISRIVTTLLTVMALTPAKADNSFDPVISDSLQKLVQYFYNFGIFLGFDVTTPSPQPSHLINSDFTQVAQTYFMNTFFGAIPVNTAAASVLSNNNFFFPSSNGQNATYGALAIFNTFGNATFSKPPYNADGTQNGGVSVNAQVDQKPYLNDPVSQSLLNILSTSSFTYCIKNGKFTSDEDCPPLTGGVVMQNIVGSIPGSRDAFKPENVMAYLPQLNTDSLLAPLMYDTSSSNNATPPSSDTGSNKPSALSALNEAQMAANFIRYVTNSVNPIQLPTLNEYDTLFAQATDPRYDDTTQELAKETITGYLTNVRAYTAQMSVAYSNLYSMLSRRLPQTTTTGSEHPTSQAMNEFVMATWRLYNPNQQQKDDTNNGSTMWLQKINNGSTATVEKEIAILLAEINYQLYLSRQQQERILLTESITLVKSNRATPPNPSLKEQMGTGG